MTPGEVSLKVVGDGLLYGILRSDLGDLEAIADDLRRTAAGRGSEGRRGLVAQESRAILGRSEVPDIRSPAVPLRGAETFAAAAAFGAERAHGPLRSCAARSRRAAGALPIWEIHSARAVTAPETWTAHTGRAGAALRMPFRAL